MSRAISNRFPHSITPPQSISRKSGLVLVKRMGPRALNWNKVSAWSKDSSVEKKVLHKFEILKLRVGI